MWGGAVHERLEAEERWGEEVVLERGAARPPLRCTLPPTLSLHCCPTTTLQ